MSALLWLLEGALGYTSGVLGPLSSSLLVAALAQAPAISDVVHTKSATATFTAATELRLVDGKIWWRPRSATASALEPWTLVPKDGVPSPPTRVAATKERLGLRGTVRKGAFEAPGRIVAIAADGQDLIAVDERHRVYATRLDRVRWSDRFATAARAAPLKIPAGAQVALAVRRHPYVDVDGNRHATTVDVTTVYALSADGGRITFTDRRTGVRLTSNLCLPERGAVRGVALSASASTIALLDDSGRVYTRFADVESMGHDAATTYSWRRERRSGARAGVRSLPPPPWRAQPMVPGPFAREVTLVPPPREGAPSELRVPTDGGYYAKPLDGGSWTLVTTGVRRRDALAAAPLTPRAPRPAQVLEGTAWYDAATSLRQFDPLCPPAEVVVERDGERVVLELWMREGLEALPRGRDLTGALVLPTPVKGELATDLRALLGDTTVEVRVDVDDRRVVVRSANRTRAEPRLTFTRR